MKASYQRYILNFKQPSGTSRGILKTKETFFLKIEDGINFGIGECGLFRGLSADDRPDYEEKLQWVCKNISLGKERLWEELLAFPSIQFGLETAFQSLGAKNSFELFPSEFTEGEASIAINGLIWMGEKEFMKKQINEKLHQGFRCLKLKIGAIDFNTELELLKHIRNEFSIDDLEIRVDANGAFQPKDALEKLKWLSDFELHSIEQPIKQGQIHEMATLCEKTPLPIALDEELIEVFGVTKKKELLPIIKPQYIILKPSLVGGFLGGQQWIDAAEKNGIGWWITSALESNIGLNAIAQWTFLKNTTMPQGLGTGSLFTNNIPSPLKVTGEKLGYSKGINWNPVHNTF